MAVDEIDETRGVLLRLTPRQREVVVLRYDADLPLGGIADILGISTGTVKSTLHQALAVLREVVDPGAASTSTSAGPTPTTPTTVAPGGSIAVESVNGCDIPGWATTVIYLVEVWHDRARVTSDIPMQAPNGFTWAYETAVDQAPGTYEIRATCGAFRSPTDIPDIATYDPRTFTVTG